MPADFRNLYTPENIAAATSPAVLAGVLFISFIVSVIRYLSWSSALYWLFYVKNRTAWAARKLQAAWPGRRQVAQEIRWSIGSCAVYAVMTVVLFYAAVKGWTRLYLNFSDYGWPWFLGSFVVMLLLHDAYFYWTHRLSHKSRWLFRRVHRIHHQVTNPTPFADIMFHPVDALIHAGFVPLFLFTLPLHPFAFGLFLTFVTVINALGHIGYEVIPEGWRTNPVLRHVSRAAAHNAHHALVHGNYGLYFTIWDRLLGSSQTEWATDEQKSVA